MPSTSICNLFTTETIIIIQWLINAEFHFITTKIPNSTAGGLSSRSLLRYSSQQDITTTTRVRAQAVCSATHKQTPGLNIRTDIYVYICLLPMSVNNR